MELKPKLTPEEFLKTWEILAAGGDLSHFLEQYSYFITDKAVQSIKIRASELAQSRLQEAVQLALSLRLAASLTGRPTQLIQALLAEGNAARWQGQHRKAIARYDEAREKALLAGNFLEAARSQIGKVYALMILGESRQAVRLGNEIRPVLVEKNEFSAVVNLDLNLGICFSRLSEFTPAINVWERGIELCNRHQFPGWPGLAASLRFNIALALAEQNRYLEGLEQAEAAAKLQKTLGNHATLAMYQEAIGFFYLQLGQFNKALRLLDEARQVFQQNNMQDYLIFCELYIIQTNLALNRHARVAGEARILLDRLKSQELEKTLEAARAQHYLGVALANLGQIPPALKAFEEAAFIFNLADNPAFGANPQLDQAEIYYREGDFKAAEEQCNRVLEIYRRKKLEGEGARSQILLGKIKLAVGELEDANALARIALATGKKLQLSLLVYQALLLRAEIAEARGFYPEAVALYRESLAEVEQMRGRVAIEARPAFVEDKEAAYQGAVAMSLKQGEIGSALEIVEQGKSRGLLDLLAGDLDIRVKIHTEADRELVEELEGWRGRRNEIASRLANLSGGTGLNVRGNFNSAIIPRAGENSLPIDLRQCEKQINRLVERLQVRNAAYAEDVSLLVQVPALSFKSLGTGRVLLEYYICRGEVLAFIVCSTGVEVVRNLSTSREVNRSLSHLRLNLASVIQILAAGPEPAVRERQLKGAEKNALALLYKLYQQLVEPLAPFLKDYRKLIIVPHGPLHYLPFHALFNRPAGRFLVEEWQEISYLPSSGLLELCLLRGERQAHQGGRRALVMGVSQNGLLPECVNESLAVGALLERDFSGGCRHFQEEEATLETFLSQAPEATIIHLATHGTFRPDDPLFSCLALFKGDLTGQDLFNIQLNASLVTFSACETGLGVLGGGDELLGLNRACLYAGASSLLVSLWRVEDHSVAHLMETFYRYLLSGESKASSLCRAQLDFLQNPATRHPFFWAPFILTGHPGAL